MVKIQTLQEIDQTKLRNLIKKRGHGILDDRFFDKIKEVLENKHSDLEVHQCDCGEIMIISNERAEQLKNRYNSENVFCKRCKDYEHEVVNLEFLHRFERITKFIDEKDVFVTKTEQNMSPEDVKTLGELALGLFPTSTHPEMMVGYHDYSKMLFGHFQVSPFNVLPEVEKLLNDAVKTNRNEFERLYSEICDWKKTHQANMNIYSKEDMLSVLKSQGHAKSLEEDFFEQKNIDLERGKLHLALSTYQDTVEIEVYLDFLLNLINIINGKIVTCNPFSEVNLPPLKVGGKARKINTLSDKIDLLSGKLPFDIKLMYNTHLRNAIAHNELEVRVPEKLLLLTNYSEQLTFKEFHSILEAVKKLHGSINTLLANYQIAKTRPKVVNQGIAAAVLGYTDFFEEDGKLHPRAPCVAQLSIHQYWDFLEIKDGKRIFPSYELELDQQSNSLNVDFGDNGALFVFPQAPDLIEWLEQLFINNQIHVVLYTIAPILPVFAEKAIMRVPIGGKIDVYTLLIDEKNVVVTNEFLRNIATFLGH